MTIRWPWIAIACSLALFTAAAAEPGSEHAAHRELRGDAPAADRSVWEIPGAFTDQRGERVTLASLRGSPALLAFFYGTCDSVCPIIVRDLQDVEASLSASDRARTRFVLVTIDPSVDTPVRLGDYATAHGLDPGRWRLLSGAPEQVRVLANVLGVKYRPTGTGQFSHTIRITLLDQNGVAVDHYDGFERSVESIATRTRALLAK